MKQLRAPGLLKMIATATKTARLGISSRDTLVGNHHIGFVLLAMRWT